MMDGISFHPGLGHVHLYPGELLAWLLVGLIAGFLAAKLVRGQGMGCLLDICVGLVGAVIGGFLMSLLGINETFHFLGTTLVAFLGASLLLLLVELIAGGRRSI
ncbi:GlsB/YeaQ/YmgE family stress response membrane protein [Thermogemmatispora onikobensis]|uniref:GlsB/YeaQ/YmgE family stress response membrane protein n=1 Tax=Thermogemmatispora onikobensis TaxID=732234 RepID=UPI001C40638D|nr:GlsB/YeaQ/YmgE family stress response membrane protein [Thermogemmatispora onikobensis]